MRKNFKILILLLVSFNYSFSQVKVDISGDTTIYTFDGIIESISKLNVVDITKQSDFDTTAFGLIDIKDGITYRQAVSPLILTRSLDLTSITTLSSFQIGVNGIVYNGTGAMYQGNPTGSFLVDDALVFSNGSNSIWDIKGNGDNILIVDRSTYIGFESVGKIDSIGAINYTSVQHSNCGKGLIWKDIGILAGTTIPTKNDSTSNSPRNVFVGHFQSISFTNSPLSIQDGESAFQFSKNFTVSEHVTITGNPFSDALGGEFLATAKSNTSDTIEDNLSGKIRINTSVNHGLTIEQVIGLTSTLHNGDYNVLSIVDSNTFDLDAAFLGADTTNWTTGNSNNFLDSNQFTFQGNGTQIDSDEQLSYRSDTLIYITISDSSVNGDDAVLIESVSTNWIIDKDRRHKVQAPGDPNGSARYTGIKNRSAFTLAKITVDVDGGSAVLMTGYLTLDGVVQFNTGFTAQSGRTVTLQPSGIIDYTTGCRIGTAIENNENTNNISVTKVQIVN